MKAIQRLLSFLLLLSLLALPLIAFKSDELLVDDEEFGLEGAQPLPLSRSPDLSSSVRSTTHVDFPRKRLSESDSDYKIQFPLEHAFGDSDFTPAVTFSVRLKDLESRRPGWYSLFFGNLFFCRKKVSKVTGKTLTKLRFLRNSFTKEETEKFKELLQGDDFYRIRLRSNVLGPPGRDYIISSVKARCLPREGMPEHFVIHTVGYSRCNFR